VTDFSGLDFLHLDDELADEERLARDTVREFVSREFLPRIQEHVRRDGSFPMELVPRIAELGLFGANLSGWGCAGMSNVGYGLVMQELERGDSGLRSFASVQGALVMYPIHAFGSDAQKDRWLPALQSGRAIGCFGLTEPDFGSHIAALRTRAERRGAGWVLNGAKRWITNGTLADVAVVWARTDDGVAGFLVEKGTPGFEATTMEGKGASRAIWQADIRLDGVRVPDAARLPGAERFKDAGRVLVTTRITCAWAALGHAVAAYDAALTYAKRRKQFGKPLCAFQIVQDRLVKMLAEVTGMQLYCMQIARLEATGRLTDTIAGLAKLNNTRKARGVIAEARDLLGGNGILLENHVIRHQGDIEVIHTYEGTETVQTLIVGRDITGIGAFA
jgi:glutaryl-CoA dehydrogenase